MHKKEDRRTARTKELIFNAFLQMVVEKGYERVNVRNIADCADIGRSTFYTHFNNKEDVLDSSLARLFDRLYERSEDDKHEVIVPATSICIHLTESKIMRQVFDLDFIASKFQQQLQIAIFRKLRILPTQSVSKNKLLIYSHMLSGSFISLLKLWITSGMKETPENVAEIFSDFLLMSKDLPCEDQQGC